MPGIAALTEYFQFRRGGAGGGRWVRQREQGTRVAQHAQVHAQAFLIERHVQAGVAGILHAPGRPVVGVGFGFEVGCARECDVQRQDHVRRLGVFGADMFFKDLGTARASRQQRQQAKRRQAPDGRHQ
ncbi:hypothetical protein D3C71_1718930 [compost metagenome]